MFDIDDEWKEFFDNTLLTRCWTILNNRRQTLANFGKNIFPNNDQIFDMCKCISPDDVRTVIVLPHPYSFDSGTGVPCMITRSIGYKTKTILNLQKIFKVIENDFSNMWKEGVLLCNIALTEEEDNSSKIPHELFWSLITENFINRLSVKFENITFCFTGSSCNKYKKFVNLENNHKIVELPSITDDSFASRFFEYGSRQQDPSFNREEEEGSIGIGEEEERGREGGELYFEDN